MRLRCLNSVRFGMNSHKIIQEEIISTIGSADGAALSRETCYTPKDKLTKPQAAIMQKLNKYQARKILTLKQIFYIYYP